MVATLVLGRRVGGITIPSRRLPRVRFPALQALSQIYHTPRPIRPSSSWLLGPQRVALVTGPVNLEKWGIPHWVAETASGRPQWKCLPHQRGDDPESEVPWRRTGDCHCTPSERGNGRVHACPHERAGGIVNLAFSSRGWSGWYRDAAETGMRRSLPTATSPIDRAATPLCQCVIPGSPWLYVTAPGF